MVDGGGSADIQQIYDAVENAISPARLSDQGRASLRYFVNRCAVQAGYVRPYDRSDPGWHITAEGREYAASEQEPPEVVHNVETQVDEFEASNSVRGAAFERYALELLKRLFPGATWFHQGSRKQFERGLDFVGTPLGEMHGPPQRIGVQVKFHAAQHAPTDQEWEKFLAGCTLRRIAKPVFITTGRLTSRQRRDASEAGIEVIEGQDEVTRVAERYGLYRFELLDDG
jgi:hypothetical protein